MRNSVLRRSAGLLAVLAWAGGTAFGAEPPNHPEASPPAIDLSALLNAPARVKSGSVAIDKLDDSTGAAGLMLGSLRGQNREDPDVVRWTNGSDQAQIAASPLLASRVGKTLLIKRRGAEPWRFVDWSRAPRPDADGDGETFRYAGPLGNSGYYKVDGFYEHDAPHVFLLNPESGAVLSVHTGDDHVLFSNSRNQLIVMNSGLNPPFGVVVAGLNAQGHEIELHCQAGMIRNRNARIIPYFAGWHKARSIGFDLVLLVQQPEAGAPARYEAVPVRFSQQHSRWRVQVPEPERFRANTGLACTQ